MLEHYDTQWDTLLFLRSYLKNRKQKVAVETIVARIHISDWKLITSGVGSCIFNFNSMY